MLIQIQAHMLNFCQIAHRLLLLCKCIRLPSLVSGYKCALLVWLQVLEHNAFSVQLMQALGHVQCDSYTLQLRQRITS